jgi:hypothetical protein
MKTFKQLIEDMAVTTAAPANTTSNALPDKEPVVNKKAQSRYKKQNSCGSLNIASRKVSGTL